MEGYKMRKMKKNNIKLMVFAVTSMMILTACGASGGYESSMQSETMMSGDVMKDYDDAGVYDEEYGETTPSENIEASGDNQEAITKQNPLINRKLIKEVELEVETEDCNSLLDKVENQIKESGGYVQNLSTDGNYNNSTVIVARIPQEKLDDFVQSVEESSNITRRSESVEDVTLHYADTEGQKAMYKAEQEKLIELLDMAQSIEEMIVIESRLSEVGYEIECRESMLRNYDSLIDFSTITLYIDEVERYTPQVEKGAMEKMEIGFDNSMYEIKTGFLNFLIGLVVISPYLVIMFVIMAVPVVIALIILKIMKKRRIKKQLQQQQFQQQPQQEIIENKEEKNE